MIEILYGLLFLVLAIPILIFGIYGIIILYYGKLKRSEENVEQSTENKSEPLVSVVIATHNEEKIISKKIENILSSNYPIDKIEIVLVDDSNDSTPQIIDECSKKYSNIQLIRFNERMGYSPSMVAGVKAAKGQIIVLNDAGSFLDVQAIRNSVARLEDPEVGVVTGKDMILNINESVGKSESIYLRILDFLRTAETNLDSTFIIKGEATAVRKDLIKDLEICGETFDTTVGLFVRQQGYKVVYDPTVKFYEYAPSTNSDLIKQKTNRGANWIKVLWRYRHVMFKRKYGKYGSIILPMDFGMIAVAPVMIMIAFTLLVVLTFFNPSFFAFIWAGLGFIFLLFLVFSRNLILTFVRFEYSLIKAFYQVIFTKRNHDRLDKVDSTRRC